MYVCYMYVHVPSRVKVTIVSFNFKSIITELSGVQFGMKLYIQVISKLKEQCEFNLKLQVDQNCTTQSSIATLLLPFLITLVNTNISLMQ